MTDGYSEYGGGPTEKPPPNVDVYPVKTAGRKLRAGYTRGTDDIVDPLDPRAWTGEVKLEDLPPEIRELM